MILKYRRFLESQQLKPTVGEVKEYFSEILQDFCDNNKYDVKFYLICNNHNTKNVNDSDEMKWVIIYIKCELNLDFEKKPFTTKELYPTIKLLLDWSIKENSKVIEYDFIQGHLTDKERIRIISDIEYRNSMEDTYVICEPAMNPHNFTISHKVYDYHLTIKW